MSSRQCCVRQGSKSADFARPKMGCECPRTCAVVSWTSSWTARRFGALEGQPDVSATTKHVRSALRMRDVDRTARRLATSRPFTFQRQPGGKK
jgi:hypothetical protein